MWFYTLNQYDLFEKQSLGLTAFIISKSDTIYLVGNMMKVLGKTVNCIVNNIIKIFQKK